MERCTPNTKKDMTEVDAPKNSFTELSKSTPAHSPRQDMRTSQENLTNKSLPELVDLLHAVADEIQLRYMEELC